MIAWAWKGRARSSSYRLVSSVARTHIGLVRQINEDRVFDCPERGVWAIADGMGGHAGGDLAAQSVVDSLRLLTERDSDPVATDVIAAIQAANDEIGRRNAAQSSNAGSTVVAAHFAGDVATIAWVGDSRAYRIRHNQLTLLTHDHSVVQDLIDAGLLTHANASRHPQANVVTRALGIKPDVQVDKVNVELRAGDRLLLCSDGLSGSLTTEDIDISDALNLSEMLLSRALNAGGRDNISFVIVDF